VVIKVSHSFQRQLSLLLFFLPTKNQKPQISACRSHPKW
jgi:hypothetical protein